MAVRHQLLRMAPVCLLQQVATKQQLLESADPASPEQSRTASIL